MSAIAKLLYDSAQLIEAVASVVTMAVAVFVLRQANSIRRFEGIYRQNQAWNEFGHAVAELHEGNRIGELLLGRLAVEGTNPVKAGAELNPREAFLLMSFFNVVSSEYNAYAAKAIDERYVLHSLTMTSAIIEPNEDWIFRFLCEYGYEESFRRVVAVVHLTENDIDRRRFEIRYEMSRGTVRGWLRRRNPFARKSKLDLAAIQAMCEGKPPVRKAAAPAAPDEAAQG